MLTSQQQGTRQLEGVQETKDISEIRAVFQHLIDFFQTLVAEVD